MGIGWLAENCGHEVFSWVRWIWKETIEKNDNFGRNPIVGTINTRGLAVDVMVALKSTRDKGYNNKKGWVHASRNRWLIILCSPLRVPIIQGLEITIFHFYKNMFSCTVSHSTNCLLLVVVFVQMI